MVTRTEAQEAQHERYKQLRRDGKKAFKDGASYNDIPEGMTLLERLAWKAGWAKAKTTKPGEESEED